MGFDNECILNIQSLAGEYFCPVCRLLVLPNEALQSQCTHLYCKPCLTYVVSTTKACPYDGYLVTEADSKPLVESNKALAETISTITVHCLYHRSGCTWQGTLSECLVHCSGCAFGNSPVVCNRCGIQIVHRQVQEHAQNCPGVPQAQQAGSAQAATATSTTTGDQTHSAPQTGTATSQAQTPQSNANSAAGQAVGQVANLNSQAQVTAPAAVVSTDQWYQQQYQQYYQQYTNYDAYYQQYYPYQQQVVQQFPQQNQQVHGSTVAAQQQVYVQSQQQPQPQVQAQGQPQPQPQAHPQAQPQQQSLGQPQLYSSALTNMAAQSQNVAHINQQQQPNSYLATSQISSQSQAQAPSQSHPYTQGQMLPQVQTQPQFQQPHLQVQQAQGPILQQPQTQLHSQAVTQPHIQPQSQPLASQPNQPLNTSLPLQHPSAHAVTGNLSYPQPQPQLQPQPRPLIQLGGVQHPLPMHPQGGYHSQLPHQAQIQSPHHPQHPQMHPLQSHAPTANQQNPPLLPSPGTVVQQQVHPNALQSGLPVQQLGTMQQAQAATLQPYVQQPLSGQLVVPIQNQMSQHMPLVQQHLPVQSHLRPLGTPHSLQQHSHAYQQPTQNVASAHAVRPQPSQYNMPRPSMQNHGMQSLPFTHTTVEVKSKQLHANQPPIQSMSEVSGDKLTDKHVAGIDGDSSIISRDKSEVGVKSEADIKPINNKVPGEVGDSGGVDISLKDVSESSKTVKTESEFYVVGVNEKAAEEKIIEEQTDVSQFDSRKTENSVSEGKESNGGSLMRMPPLHDKEKSEEHGRKLNHDQVQSHAQVTPKERGPSDFKESQFRPERHKHMPSHYVSNPFQQRPPAPGIFQGPPSGPPVHAQTPGLPPSQLRPQGPGHTALPENLPPGPYGMGPNNYPPQGPFSQGPYSGAPRISQGESIGRPTLGMPRFTSLDSHGAPYGSDSGMNSNMMTRLNGDPSFDSAPVHGFRNNRINTVHDEQMDRFPMNSGRHVSGQGPVDGDHQRFPRPPHVDAEPLSKFGSYHSASSLDKGPHGPNFDHSGFSRNFPPYNSVGRLPPNDAGERLGGLHDDPIGRRDFVGSVPGFGRRHMDNFASRSPGGDYPGMSPPFRGHPGDEIDNREHRFGRFPGAHRVEFEGPDNFHMAELMGRDLPPNHLRRGDFMDPRSLPPDLRYREAAGFGPFSSHERIGEFTRPGDIRHSRLGEPGFRSSFSLQGFANDNRVFGGDMDSFESMRKRKPTSMGWCRICKVDCETVEGLDLHSQTREHQKMAMDMVASIKQNSKKQKLNPSDRSVANDAKKLRNTGFDGRGSKH